ncbi:hypothetical protein ACMD2_11160, partial [Ananas comosus]
SVKADLGPEFVDENAAGGVTDEGAEGRDEAGEALHVRRERRLLDAVPRDARVDCHVGDRDRRRHAHEAHQCRDRREAASRRDYLRGTCDDEIGAAAIAADGNDVGEDAPDGLQDPGNVVQAHEQLHRRRLRLLHVLPVVVRHDAKERPREPVAQPVDEHDADHERRVQLPAQHRHPSERLRHQPCYLLLLPNA